MTAPKISTPVSAGSPSHGFAWKPVQVLHVDLERRMAMCVDDFGKYQDIRCDIMRAKGNLPEKNEQWLVTREFGIWTFAAIINGTTRGVEVSNVTDLPDEIDRIDTANTTTASNAQAANSTLRSDSVGKIIAKGDLLAGVSAGQVVQQPVGTLNQSLVADPSTSTGLTYRDITGRPAGYSGLPGAQVAGRWVGNTSGTAPTTGTFLTGDWVMTPSGPLWCTAGGTPGTWTSPASLTNRPAGVICRSGLYSSTAGVGNQSLSTGAAAIRTFGPVKAGRLYRIGTDNLALAADNAPVRVNAGLRISTDGTNTNSGGTLYQQQGTVIQSATAGGTNRPETHPLRAFYSPSADCTLSVSIVISSGSTVGGAYPNVWIFAGSAFAVDNYIEDLGIDPGT